MSKESGFDKAERQLRARLFRVDRANTANEPISSYDLHDCFILLNQLIAEHKKVVKDNEIDLSKCEKGDILISSLGAVLEYVAPTPYENYSYLDHVVKYVRDVNGEPFVEFGESLGTRTNDGFVFAKKREPKTDHDIVMVIKKQES
jgi:hypothetical protein